MFNKMHRITQAFSRFLRESSVDAFLRLSVVIVKSIVFVPLINLFFLYNFHHSPSVEIWLTYGLTAFWFQRVSEKTRDAFTAFLFRFQRVPTKARNAFTKIISGVQEMIRQHWPEAS